MEDFDQRIIERARHAIAKSRDLLNQDRATPKNRDQVSNQNTIVTEVMPHPARRYFPSLARD
jgi:hypothetical protein